MSHNPYDIGGIGWPPKPDWAKKWNTTEPYGNPFLDKLRQIQNDGNNFYDTEGQLRSEVDQLKNRLALAESAVYSLGLENDTLRASFQRFVKIAFDLFKRTTHQKSCDCRRKFAATCTCGLSLIELEITKQTSKIVLDSMIDKGK